MNPVLASIEPVIERASHVAFDPEAAARFVDALPADLSAPTWTGDTHFGDGTERTVWYVLVLDTINFCFWGEPRWRFEYRGEALDGYAALSAALRRAFERGVPLHEPEFLLDLTVEQLASVLDGEGRLPLMDERTALLRELGGGLLQHFGGDAAHLVRIADGSALKLVEFLVEAFPGFRDEASYGGSPVLFYKRAQIAAADLHGTFGGRGYGAFYDIDQLTAFADYKLPQLLRAHGILQYEPALAARVDRQVELPPGSEEEIEIRAFTIHAVEELKALLNRRQTGDALPHEWASFEVDWLLWNRSQGLEAQPYHRTRTIYY